MSEGYDVRDELTEAMDRYRARYVEKYGKRPEFEVGVTTAYRKRILRAIGWDENLPVRGDETVYGQPVVVDDSLPPEPGFAIRGDL